MTHRNLTCPELDERLGDYLEGALDDSTAAAIELHLSGCAGCRAVVQDFERISQSAAALPELTPSHDLWPAIAQRIQAPVADLAARTAARRGAASPHAWRRWRAGAMAAGLVGITAITTYVVSGRPATSSVAQSAGGDSALAAPVVLLAATPLDTSPASTPIGGTPTLAGAPVPAPATPVTSSTRVPARETFTSEISTLRGIVSERRDQLDPRTIAVLETSISTIDSAIADARRALEADPASRFLSSQLNKSLEKKLGLLRTVALLPSRT